jgi:hypothetical protein
MATRRGAPRGDLLGVVAVLVCVSAKPSDRGFHVDEVVGEVTPWSRVRRVVHLLDGCSIGSFLEAVADAGDRTVPLGSVLLGVGDIRAGLRDPPATVDVDDERWVLPLREVEVELQLASLAIGVRDPFVDGNIVRHDIRKGRSSCYRTTDSGTCLGCGGATQTR